MSDLSITYYFGQIKKEYSGNYALFMEVDVNGFSDFKTIPLNSNELTSHTSGLLHSPMRAYIGVSENAQLKLEERFKQGQLRSAFDLDLELVRQEIVYRRLDEVNNLESASLSAMVRSGK